MLSMQISFQLFSADHQPSNFNSQQGSLVSKAKIPTSISSEIAFCGYAITHSWYFPSTQNYPALQVYTNITLIYYFQEVKDTRWLSQHLADEILQRNLTAALLTLAKETEQKMMLGRRGPVHLLYNLQVCGIGVPSGSHIAILHGCQKSFNLQIHLLKILRWGAVHPG